LMLQLTLGVSLLTTKGYAASDVEQAYTRARELCRQVGDTPQLFPVLRGLWNCYAVQAKLQRARDLGEQLLTLAQRQQDSVLLPLAYRALGSTLLWLGEFTPAQEHLERGTTLYAPQRHRSHLFLYGEDPELVCQLYTALALWTRGYPDQALQRMNAAL